MLQGVQPDSDIMKLLFYLEKDKYQKANDALLKNDLLSRQSINFRDAASLGLKEIVYYLELDCSEEAVEEAKKVLKELAKELTGTDRDKVSKLIQKQDEAAQSGFGAIFGE